MVDISRTRSPHAKLQEFLDCFLDTDHRKELEDFSTPQLARPTREEFPDEALRYLAVLLLYGLSERVEDISLVRKAPDEVVCRMSGEQFYDVPTPREEVVTSLFSEIEEMAGMDTSRRIGRLIVGLKNDEIELKISSVLSDAGEEKILIHLPTVA